MATDKLLMVYRYVMMMKCWEMEPDNRPSFSELQANTATYLEKIANYLEIGFNPFVKVEQCETIVEKKMVKGEEVVFVSTATIPATTSPEDMDESSD